MTYPLDIKKYEMAMARTNLFSETGKVTRIVGNVIQGYTPGASIGSICSIMRNDWSPPLIAEIVGFKDRHVLAMPTEDPVGVSMGATLTITSPEFLIKLSPELLGRILGGEGTPIDGKGAYQVTEDRSIYSSAPLAVSRQPVTESLDLGIRALNGFVTVGVGQRMGIFSGSGVGKSVLLGMMARESNADVNVIALIGERGREVNEFISQQLGEEGLKKSVVVVVTSDQAALLRRRGAFIATTIAEYFRDQGKRVLLMMDSVTRFAMAQREIGLATGEPPTTKGYTPSVFGLLPRLLERAGNSHNAEGGGITGLFTVLVEGDELDDPIADAVRSILDGHIVLSRALSEQNHFPAIDVLASVSRTMINTVSAEHISMSHKLRAILSIYRRNEDLITVGAYVKGANPELDEAISKYPQIIKLLRQDRGEKGSIESTLDLMRAITRS